MKKTFGTKVFAVLAALAVLLTFALPKAACAQSVYHDTGDFELRCVYGNMPLENMRFSVYRVADMPSLGKFSLLPAFEESGADIENIERRAIGTVLRTNLRSSRKTCPSHLLKLL